MEATGGASDESADYAYTVKTLVRHKEESQLAITITNYATLDYISGTMQSVAFSNIAATTLRQNLAIYKDAYRPNYRRGEVVTYIIQIVSQNGVTGPMTVTDDLGSYTLNGRTYTPLDYQSYVLYVGQTRNPETGGVSVTVIEEQGSVQFVFDNLPATFPGLTLLVQARVNEYAPLDTEDRSITNTATLTVGQSVVSTAQATITAEDYAELQILKSMTPDPVSEGTPLTYTFVICNFGTIAPTELTLRDTFVPAPRAPLAVTVNDQTANAFDYNVQTGLFVLGSAASEPYALEVPAATFVRDETTGAVIVRPGMTTVRVSGIIGM